MVLVSPGVRGNESHQNQQKTSSPFLYLLTNRANFQEHSISQATGHKDFFFGSRRISFLEVARACAKCYILYYLFMLSVYTNNCCSLVPGDILPWHHFGSDMEASFNRRKVQLQNDKQIFRNQQKATIYHVKILVIQACNM